MTLLPPRPTLPALFLLLAANLTEACGGSGGNGDGHTSNNADGSVTSEWTDYCVATFTQDFAVNDVFGDPAFTAKSGSSYLISSFDAVFGDEATLLFLTNHGPEEFQVASLEGGGWPFTANCEADMTTSYYAVFDDVTVYTTDALDAVLCELPSGHVVENNGTSGYSTSDFNFSGPTTYEVVLGGFSAECGNAESGYVSVPESQVWGVTTWLVPLRLIVGPAPAP